MNSYAIELTDGEGYLFDADWIEIQNGFFLFCRAGKGNNTAEAIRYQACAFVAGITLQEEKTLLPVDTINAALKDLGND